MKLIIKSKNGILDKRFMSHLINLFPTLVFTKENNLKLKKIDGYLQKNIFNGKRTYSMYQIVMVVLNNIDYHTDNKTAVIQIDNSAVFPFYNMKVKDVASLIDSGNLDIKGTHVFKGLFAYVEKNIEKLRRMYEMGIF